MTTDTSATDDQPGQPRPKLNWVIPPWAVLGIAACCLAYTIVLILLGMYPIFWPHDTTTTSRLYDFAHLWTILCSLAGWISVALKRPPQSNSRIWPIVLVPALIGVYLTLRQSMEVVASPRSIPSTFDWWMRIVGVLLPVILFFVLCGALVLQGIFGRKYGLQNTCFECGYNMTGNLSGRCPECGTQYDEKSSWELHISSRPYPELLLLETAEQRRRIWKEVHRSVNKSRLSAMMSVCLLVGLGVLYLTADRFQSDMALWQWGVLAILVSGSMAFVWRVNRLYHRQIRQQLRNRGISVCMKCGADLHEVHAGTCPKCGAEVQQPAKTI